MTPEDKAELLAVIRDLERADAGTSWLGHLRAVFRPLGSFCLTGMSKAKAALKITYPWVLGIGIGLAIAYAYLPSPGPRPSPVPPTPVPPAPIPVGGLQVFICYDPANITEDEKSVVFGKAVRDYLRSHCVVGADGKSKDFWILQTGLDVSGGPQWIQDVTQKHPGQKTWMWISNGKAIYDGPLPANAEAALAILRKYGG